MPACTITVGIINNSMLLNLLEFFDTPEDIIGVLDGTPCLNEKVGIHLSLLTGSGMGPKIVSALYPEREDLIVKHKIKFYGTSSLLGSATKDDEYVEKMKKFIDVVVAHHVDPVEAQLLRWIPARVVGTSKSIIARKLADYCFEKGYHAGVSDGLINAIDADGIWDRSYYEKYLDAGADPIAMHTASGRDNAISAAFKKKDMDAIRLFAERGYDLSAEIAKIPRAERHLYTCFPVKKMINGIFYTLSGDKKTATAVQLTTSEGLVTTQLTVVVLEDKKYMFINPVNRTVFGEQIPVSELTE